MVNVREGGEAVQLDDDGPLGDRNVSWIVASPSPKAHRRSCVWPVRRMGSRADTEFESSPTRGAGYLQPPRGGFQLSRANRQEAGSRGRCHVGVSQPRILNPVSGHELCDSRNGSLTLSEPYLQPPTSACGSNGRPPVWCSTVALPVEVDA